ncbi:hypothetical protein QDX12_07450 [Escherichia coli]|nr:hypothetical protein QDX12_07450 [Escherichia coli]WHG70437.1 hypothetical protein QDW94_07415 [Escherichia coli]
MIRLDAVVKEIAITILRPNFVHGESFGTNEKLRRERVFSGKHTFSEVMLDAAKEIKTVKPQLREQSGLRYRKTTHRN